MTVQVSFRKWSTWTHISATNCLYQNSWWHNILSSGGSRISQRGAPTPEGTNVLFGIIFAENCMKMKIFGRRGGHATPISATAFTTFIDCGNYSSVTTLSLCFVLTSYRIVWERYGNYVVTLLLQYTNSNETVCVVKTRYCHPDWFSPVMSARC